MAIFMTFLWAVVQSLCCGKLGRGTQYEIPTTINLIRTNFIGVCCIFRSFYLGEYWTTRTVVDGDRNSSLVAESVCCDVIT